MPSKLRNLVQPTKPEIKISFNSKKATYTTLDRIEGVATIIAPVDTPFDAVDIEFVGTSRTYVERLTTAAAASGRSEAFHQFLKLSQPGNQQHYPEDLVLKAGQRYDFPFVFAVPEQLLMRVCQHTVHSDAVRESHYRLPPTFGDKDLNNGRKALDDMAPDMASVRYGIFVKITELKTRGDETLRTIVASKARRMRVIPAAHEQPPLSVYEEDGEYVMRKEKTLRKGVLKGKLGTLVMEAAQPQSLSLKSYGNPEARTTTMATVMLRFDPVEDSLPPPKLRDLSSKLRVLTFYASTARHNFPSKHTSLLDLSQGLHSEQLGLSSRCMANVEWTKQEPTRPAQTLERRDSATSACSLGSTPEASQSYKGGSYYTARLLVPITLPTNKAFVPTFHSCLISRVYALKLDLSTTSTGLGSSLELKVPIQISAEGLIGDEYDSRRDSVATVDEELDDIEDVSSFFTNMFEPRSTLAPSQNVAGSGPGRGRIGSQAPTGDAPPGYSPFNSSHTQARMTHRRASSVLVF